MDPLVPRTYRFGHLSLHVHNLWNSLYGKYYPYSPLRSNSLMLWIISSSVHSLSVRPYQTLQLMSFADLCSPLLNGTVVFEGGHGFNPGESGLSFLGLVVGMVCSVAYIIFYVNPAYIRTADKTEGRAPPEARLPPSIIGAVLLVVGLAWFAATDGPSVHWIVPILA